MRYDVFISYRRDGGEYTAKILRDRLEELGYRVFFDVESLRSGDFNTRLYSVIDECRDFILVLSPNALDRCVNEGDWVRSEVERALAGGKNIVPVLLRGFGFPETLPESLEPLRYKNGIEASSQFFDAFVGKLQQFLETKPKLRQRFSQNTLLRRTLPFFLALMLVAVAVTGVALGVRHFGSTYPRTAAEKNLTGEMLYYVSENLTCMDIIGEAADDALQAARRYLSTGASDAAALRNTIEASRATIEGLDVARCAPDEDFLGRVSGSPFALDDTRGMHDAAVGMQAEWLEYLDYIELVTDAGYYMQDSAKLEIVECYRRILDETLLSCAYCSNDLLLPVTSDDALEEFFDDILPSMTHIPLGISSWQEDADALDADLNESYRRMESAADDLNRLVGDTNMTNEALRETLIQQYMMLGYTREQAEEAIEDSLAVEDILNEVRSEYGLRKGDDYETVWWKMTVMLSFGLCDEALECAAAYEEAVRDTDPNAEAYMPALRLFIESAAEGGIDYGVMVMAYYEPDGINELLEIGDIVIAFDGKPCRTYDEYVEMKDALTDEEYTLLVLRRDGQTFSEVTLEMTTDMPRVYLNGLAY